MADFQTTPIEALPDEVRNDPMVPPELNNNVFITTLDKLYN